ncbi:AzlC family ABC transporter permease [Streptomyces adelaidensis]|uniref:AzlC family ABC transporter permease n=1 Tax=Streptomyces adelaidensis TaxID=2796465 RepID=UPI003559218A
MRRQVTLGLLAGMLMISGIVSPTTSYAANAQLAVDLSQTTGDIAHGASGFLYGMGNAGVTTDNVLQPLHPQQAAQKPQGGLQHPSGDAFDVAPQYLRAGTKEIQIYMQDIYRYWPYEEAGLTDYLSKIDDMVADVKADPNYGKYVYVPFNEPDWIWYSGMFSNTTTRQKFFDDWKTVYNHIRALDPTTKIAGPGFASYNSRTMAEFLAYAKANDVVPDVITWHKLQNDFFTDYYNHYDHWRGVESDLDVPEIPIVGLVVAAAPLASIAVAAFMVNVRHVFYALSFPLHRVKGRVGKAYSTFALCDEAYALTSAERARSWSSPRILWLQLFLHLYWAGSATAVALLGSLIPESVTGLDFALTALFTVLALDAVRDLRGDLPTPVLAVLSALAARLVLPSQMLMVAFALFTAGLLARHFAAGRRPSRA